jgi:hypothetical protein
MEANELMIGDWVWYDNQPHQIRQLGIFGENRDGDNYPAVCVGKPNGFGLILERNEIEPILLTPKILESNGFVDEISNYAYKTDNYHICYYCEDERLSINKYGAILDVHCFYVHQLQHALRLCGIDEIIEL